MVYIYMIVINI